VNIDFLFCNFTEIHLLVVMFFGGMLRIIYRILGTAKRESFMSSFPIWIPFISFSGLFPLARMFHTTMNKSSKSGHTCFVLDLRSAFSFSPLSMMLAVGLSL